MPKRQPSSSSSTSSSDDEETVKMANVKSKKEKPSSSKSSPKKKKTKSSGDTGGKLSLSKFKLIDVREFKGKLYVDIRKYYYDSNEELKPGKQGISLTVDEWNVLKDSFEEIDAKVDAH